MVLLVMGNDRGTVEHRGRALHPRGGERGRGMTGGVLREIRMGTAGWPWRGGRRAFQARWRRGEVPGTGRGTVSQGSDLGFPPPLFAGSGQNSSPVL